MLLYVHRDRKDYQGWGAARDVRLDFHTAPEFNRAPKLLPTVII